MEVCIFGVLTVNLLTFPSRNAPSCIRTLLSRMPVFRWLAEPWKKKPKSPARARFTGLYDDWQEA